jgi:hypothetical protein
VGDCCPPGRQLLLPEHRATVIDSTDDPMSPAKNYCWRITEGDIATDYSECESTATAGYIPAYASGFFWKQDGSI